MPSKLYEELASGIHTHAYINTNSNILTNKNNNFQ